MVSCNKIKNAAKSFSAGALSRIPVVNFVGWRVGYPSRSIIPDARSFMTTTTTTIEVNLCLLVHLVINKRAPVYLQNLLSTTASVPGQASNRSASNNDLVKQTNKFKLGGRTFSVAGPRVWNQLSTDHKAITDTRIFRRKLKSFFNFFCSIGPTLSTR